MKLTSLLQLVDRLQQAGKIDNLQQVCSVFLLCMGNAFVELSKNNCESNAEVNECLTCNYLQLFEIISTEYRRETDTGTNRNEKVKNNM